MSHAADHIALIPTRNRPKELARGLAFLAAQNERFPALVVADSSRPELAEANQAACRASGLDVHYRAFNIDTNLYEKIACAAEQSEASLVTVVADDDFSVVSGALACASFLRNSPTHSATTGATLVLSRRHSDVAVTPYAQRGANARLASLRLRDHLLRYTPTFYATHRAELLVRHMRMTAQATSDYRFGELLPSCLTVIAGKLKYLRQLYLIREDSPSSAEQRTTPWRQFVQQNDYQARAEQFISTIAERIEPELGANLARGWTRHYLGRQVASRAGTSRALTRLAELRRPSLTSVIQAALHAPQYQGALAKRLRLAWRWARADASPEFASDERVRLAVELLLRS